MDLYIKRQRRGNRDKHEAKELRKFIKMHAPPSNNHKGREAGRWEGCPRCKRKNVRHYAKGFCSVCYRKLKRHGVIDEAMDLK
jgi:hypothetical protein